MIPAESGSAAQVNPVSTSQPEVGLIFAVSWPY